MGGDRPSGKPYQGSFSCQALLGEGAPRRAPLAPSCTVRSTESGFGRLSFCRMCGQMGVDSAPWLFPRHTPCQARRNGQRCCLCIGESETRFGGGCISAESSFTQLCSCPCDSPPPCFVLVARNEHQAEPKAHLLPGPGAGGLRWLAPEEEGPRGLHGPEVEAVLVRAEGPSPLLVQQPKRKSALVAGIPLLAVCCLFKEAWVLGVYLGEKNEKAV